MVRFNTTSLLRIFLLCWFLHGVTACTAPVPTTTPKTCAAVGSGSFTSSSNSEGGAFGLSDIIAGLRGGEVLEGTTAEDVDAIILKAGASQQLVVIDFSGRFPSMPPLSEVCNANE